MLNVETAATGCLAPSMRCCSNRSHFSVYQQQSRAEYQFQRFTCRRKQNLLLVPAVENIFASHRGALLTPWPGLALGRTRLSASHSISRHNEFGECGTILHWNVEGILKKYLLGSSYMHRMVQFCTSLLYTLWRMLPYRLRSCLKREGHWPPQCTRRHILEPFSLFLTQKNKKKRPAPEAIGVDTLGRSFETAQLYFERWMIEELIDMGIRQGSLGVYRSALTHPSALDPEKRFLSYERLEYLGDAVLELVVRGLLMKRITHADEGILTFQTQAMVKGDAVSAYSAWLGLDKFIMTNAYSMRSSLLESPSILCDAFEALVGAIYVDKGLDAAERFLKGVFTQCPYVDWDSLTLEKNYVAELSRKAVNELEYTMPRYIPIHSQECYRFANGSSSVLLYWQQVYMGGSLWGIGQSFDERIAQQLAAKATLDMLPSNE